MTFVSLLRHRCTINRNTPAYASGLQTPQWSVVATDVPCLIQEGSGSLKNSPAGQFLQYDAIGFFRVGTDLQPQAGDDSADQVVMTHPSHGAKYLVQWVADESGQGHHLTVYLRRLPQK